MRARMAEERKTRLEQIQVETPSVMFVSLFKLIEYTLSDGF